MLLLVFFFFKKRMKYSYNQKYYIDKKKILSIVNDKSNNKYSVWDMKLLICEELLLLQSKFKNQRNSIDGNWKISIIIYNIIINERIIIICLLIKHFILNFKKNEKKNKK